MRSRHCAIVLALLLLPHSAFAADDGATAAQPQRLSAAGESELLALVASGSLAMLQWPQFADHQDEVGEFYRSQGYVLAWVADSKPTAKARAVIAFLQSADDQGLPSKDYDGPLWADRLARLDFRGRHASESELLRFDLALTLCALRYILDLHLGRINPLLFHSDFDVEPGISGPTDFLRERIIPAEDVSAALNEIEPPFPAYRRLVKAVQHYQEFSRQDDRELLPVSKTVIEPGDAYSGVPRLTRFLKLIGDLPPEASCDPGIYCRALAQAVRRFQRRHGLEPDGALGEQTLRQLNTPLDQRLAQLRLSLERWRWLPHRFSRPPIIVNIPEFRLYPGDAPSQRVVVGMAFEHQTPVFASMLTTVIFRPPWNVPIDIQLKEIVPMIEKNSSYLREHDFEIINGRDAVVSSGTVDAALLEELRGGRLFLRQRPGPQNSLGLIKFLMPNANSVYLHGTPARGKFLASRRDFSHSCIRVEDPEALAAWVLREQPEWTQERIRAAMQGPETVAVRLTEPIPVLLQYGTATVGDGDEVHFFDDIYGLDAAEGAAFEARTKATR